LKPKAEFFSKDQIPLNPPFQKGGEGGLCIFQNRRIFGMLLFETGLVECPKGEFR
jgi:hypothetical protein